MTQLPSGSSRDNLVSTLGGKLQGTNTTAGSSQQQQPGSSNTLHSNTTRRTGTAAGLAGDSNASGYATVSGLDQEAGHGQIGLEADTVRLVIGEASVQVTHARIAQYSTQVFIFDASSVSSCGVTAIVAA